MNPRRASNRVRPLSHVEEQLLARWPERKIEPSLDRITSVMALLGDPQRTYRSVHLTGTNSKTSTARMIEALLAESGERTGRLTSPHLTSIRERISIVEDVISVPAFLSAYDAVADEAQCVDATMQHPLSFFEMTVAMAYHAFRAAAIDVAVVEVGMGGRWDATNVIDSDVAVILPIDLDHTDILGSTTAAIAQEKAGIIKTGSVAVSARQRADVANVLQARARSVSARLLVEGNDFALLQRKAVEDGQVFSARGLYGTYADLLLTLRGRHQAENAACAIVAAESILGRELASEAVRAGLARVTSPGRFEIYPGTPPMILDAAHNPHGTRALVKSLAELASCRTFGVVAAVAGKDVDDMLRELEPVIDVVVCTRNSSPRSLTAAELAWSARQVFGAQRIHVARDVAAAIEMAAGFAAPVRVPASDALVLVTGSVVTVGDATRFLSRT
ncbi:bifunctional folylpolyglutamate synthase/dihydrofolate synthase [Hoyosella altamirensis]|uniref:tetrahydrofolate synthase n=1 Tax=Hoyosella altamirensis TaxID=616997 RepID=A0A839RTI6_9ACTN|nr:folylpolyglutamate synthase/dihydrofolate synthase family protein [Hoyosella altamirensis]MBB3039213.1 dihydrofolate synthase/folylpolyglutamate synthase [Hoyosella altamirensis]